MTRVNFRISFGFTYLVMHHIYYFLKKKLFFYIWSQYDFKRLLILNVKFNQIYEKVLVKNVEFNTFNQPSPNNFSCNYVKDFTAAERS